MLAEISLKGTIKARYPHLHGSDWIKSISKEDRAALLALVRSFGLHGVLGGKARAATANREDNGRFAKG